MQETEGNSHPSRLLWIGNVAADLSEALLIQTFAKYGAVDYASAYPARSYAFIEFRNLEDAKEAKAGLQGKHIKGQPLRIEFAKPAKPSRHVWIWGVSETITKEKLEAEFKNFGPLDDFRLLRDRNSALAEFKNIEDATAAVKSLNKKIIQGEELRVDFLRSHAGKRGYVTVESHSHTGSDEKATSKEGIPSETLWIGFPPPSKVDEDGLRKAFIFFGEVERITTFPDRSYCFVQFRNVDEATRAKEGLQGRLLNDPRILIRFASNEAASKWPTKADVLHNPVNHVGVESRTFGSCDWSGAGHSSARHPVGQINIGRNMKAFSRPNGSISAGLLGAPVRGIISNGDDHFSNGRLRPGNVVNRSPLEVSGAAEKDSSEPDPKRMKLGVSDYLRGHFEGNGKFDSRFTENYRQSCVPSNEEWHSNVGICKVLNADFQVGNSSVTSTNKVSTSDNTIPWRGSLAKAGNFLCRVQSFPLGKGIDEPLPAVVNCVARTSLDKLAHHFFQAIEYRVIYFVADDGEKAAFQEFLSYLIDKHRVGVAKISERTTLFLVPPSDFTANALKVQGDCLFGLVMKFPQLENQSTTPHQEARLLPSQDHQHPQLLESTTAVALPQREVGSKPASELAYVSVPSSAPHFLRPYDNVQEANDVCLPINTETIERGSHNTEARASVSPSIQDHSRGIQAPWSSSPGQSSHWDPGSLISTELNLRIPGGNSDARPSSAMAQLLTNMQNISKVATEALVKQASVSQGGGCDGSDPAANRTINALKMGHVCQEGASDEEANSRFQATLQLAAALLKRMHDGSANSSLQ
ncbi:hypothetical protein KP509_02G071600 [Ceratopteris richardii]|nr:hypothetical protein KP509_02G071600 [Ceratopteris richardii]KAH7444273.1 hypothetical protein KP509_02G071600 [Ceratopteris richardii]KAH7444275.1 hypothetical protein KP509_02G071600 [Ceratopteris richardii]KAH7444278.1 hypothetical protein KP509_02G071600 [Ceratopteris richardii]